MAEMGWFNEQIRKRIESDQTAVEDSVRNMAGAVMGGRITRARDDEDSISGDVVSY